MAIVAHGAGIAVDCPYADFTGEIENAEGARLELPDRRGMLGCILAATTREKRQDAVPREIALRACGTAADAARSLQPLSARRQAILGVCDLAQPRRICS